MPQTRQRHFVRRHYRSGTQKVCHDPATGETGKQARSGADNRTCGRRCSYSRL